MRTAIGIALLTIGCTSAPEEKLPTASFTPHLNSQQTSVACGEDVAYYGNPSPDVRYLFTYDTAGRITHTSGTWSNNGPTDAIDYTWAGNNLTHLSSVSGWDGSEYDVVAAYDAANSLTNYTWSWSDGTNADSWSYAYSGFLAPNRPARLEITQAGVPTVWGYSFTYDTSDRLATAVADNGPTTTWTYDDVAGTIAANTGNGAYTELQTYDADLRPLSSAWGGTGQYAIDGEEVYAWNGDQLNTITLRSGSEQAPHQLQLVQTDTMRYDCSVARTNAGKLTRKVGIGMRR